MTTDSGTAVVSPMTGSVATGVVRAIPQYHGPVLQTRTNPGRTFTLAVTYLDNDGCGGLSCGDTVTVVA